METNDERNQWRPCPQGEFARLGERLVRRRRRREFLRTAGLASGAAAFAGAGLIAIMSFETEPRLKDEPAPIAGNKRISCKDVLDHAVAYRDGRLAAETCERIAMHLKRCGGCEVRYRQMGIES